jgi:uncharacterized protein
MAGAAPTGGSERIAVVDVIRGFALFGVLWVNLLMHRGNAMPYDALDSLPTAWLDDWLGFVTLWLMQGKAQALFSLLFGFGFANIMARLERRGAPPGIFLRRIGVLMLFGLANLFLLFAGDILTAYALMGALLYLTRNWSTRSLVLVGLPVAVLGMPALLVVSAMAWDSPPYWYALWEEGAAIRAEVFLQGDYHAYVAELWRSAWVEWWTIPPVLPHLAQILGRFLLGSWIFRKGWLGSPAEHRAVFVRTAAIGLPAGFVLSGLSVSIVRFQYAPEWLGSGIEQTAALVMALGYGAAIVLLHLAGRMQRLFAGFEAVGQMALTNYIAQSLFYLFVLYGFGLGLMAWLGATLSLALAVGFFAIQAVASRWWLARYRFGPLEWLWRSLTYGERQAMRREAFAV